MLTNVILIISIIIISAYQLFTKKNNAAISRKEMILICCFYSALVFVFLFFTGVINSGYHYVDDHEVYTFNYRISEQGFVRGLFGIIRTDMTEVHRFRYTYIIIRVLQSVIIGDNFLIWHIMYGVIAVFNLSIGYYYARYRGCSIIVSYLFSLIVLVGAEQTAVIWRLGPQEGLGISILFLALLFTRRLYETKNNKLYAACFLSIFFLAGVKESFLLLLPTFPLLFIIWSVEDKGWSPKLLLNCWKSFKYYFVFIGILLLISVTLVLSVTGVGYGVDSHYSISDYFRSFFNTCKYNLNKYILLAFIAFFFGLCFVVKKKNPTYFLMVLFVFCFNIGIQCFLYAKSLMWERYVIPSTIIVAIFVFVVIGRMISHERRFAINFIVIMIIACGFMCISKTQSQAIEYAVDGKYTTDSICKIAELYDGNNILTDVGYEEDYSAAVYMQSKYKIGNVYNVRYSAHDNSDEYFDAWHPETEENNSISLEEAELILLKDDSDLISSLEKSEGEYVKEEFGRYAIYKKK